MCQGFAMPDGQPVPISLIGSAYQNYSWILKRGDDFYNRICKGEIVEERSVGEYVDKEVDNYLLTKSDKERPLLRSIYDQMITRETVINGCNSLDDISLRYHGVYQTFPGGNMIIPKGFQLIVKGLLDEIEDKNAQNFKLLLNHEVTKIKWPGVDSKEKVQQVEITCANGKVFKCNHLVNTMPLGVLKAKITNLYEPKLPQYKIDCVNALGFDYVNKIYLEYENELCPEFMDPTVSELMVFWNDGKREEAKKQLDLKNNWTRKIYSFTKLSNRLLIVWLSGKEAKYALSLDPEIIGSEITKLLRSMYKNPAFPKPSKIVQTSWGTDEFTLGAYTHLR